MLFKDNVLTGTSHPGRMAPSTAICFILFGFSFLLTDNKKINFFFFQFCSIFAGSIAFISLMNYVFKAEIPSGIIRFTGMAIHTSLCFLLLMLASLYIRPETGIMRLVSRNTYGGRHFRIVFPLAIILILSPAVIQFYGVQNGLFDHNFTTSFLAILQVLSACILLLISEHILARSEIKLKQTEMKFKSVLESAKDSIILSNEDGNIIFWNDFSKQMFGFSENEIMGKSITMIIPESYTAVQKQKYSQRIPAGNTEMVYKSIELEGRRKDGREFPIEFSLSSWTIDKKKFYCGIIRDITERKKSEVEVQQMNKQLQELSFHLQTVREEERTMVAREIHDELGQQLACIKMDADWIKNNLTKEGKVKETLDDMLVQIAETIKGVRKIASELRPQMIDDLGLFSTLEWKAQDFSLRTGIKCNLQFGQDEPKFLPGAAIHIYRIFQEALTNSFRYADASEINALINCDEEKLTMIIIDNGKGFDVEKSKQNRSFGLVGMNERAKMMKGKVEIHSQKGSGTSIELNVPVIANHEEPANY